MLAVVMSQKLGFQIICFPNAFLISSTFHSKHTLYWKLKKGF